MEKRIFLLLFATLLLVTACIKIKHEMVIQPIHVTVDVTIKVDRELEKFFADIDKTAVNAEKNNTKKKEKLNEK